MCSICNKQFDSLFKKEIWKRIIEIGIENLVLHQQATKKKSKKIVAKKE